MMLFMPIVLNSVCSKDLLASPADSIAGKNLEEQILTNRDTIYYWKSISRGNVPVAVLDEAGIKLSHYKNTRVIIHKLIRDMNQTIVYYENNGYPFAEIQLTDVVFDDNHISASFLLNKNPFYQFDSIIMKGDLKINPAYLRNYIGIKKYEPYNEEKVSNISAMIMKNEFIEEIRPAELGFKDQSVDVYTYLRKEPANLINGIIGIAPGNEIDNLQLTGNVKLHLINALRQGEVLDIDWQKLESSSQRLYTGFSYPYLFGTSIGIGIDFDLYKQDSSFLTIHTRLSGKYHFKGSNHVYLYYKNRSSRIINQGNGLNIRGYATNMYGFGLDWNSLDNLYNPSRGSIVNGSFATGHKVMNQTDKRSTQIESNMRLTTFIPFLNYFTIKLEGDYGGIYGEHLYTNELMRLGGLTTIRGFDDNSIFASQYGIFTLEVRYLFQSMSNIHLFWDGGYYESKEETMLTSDTPYSIGTGFMLSTTSGIFSFTYAVGKQFNNPLKPLEGKIHVGYINRF